MPKNLVKRKTILKTKFYAKSDIGKSRERNEDAFLVHEPRSKNKREIYGLLYAVADGVGGYSRGDYASKLALKIINDFYYSQSPDIEPAIRLRNAILKANEVIYQENLKNSESKRMSTTVVVAIVLGDKAIIANVGDSRAYLINKKYIKQITRDHSLVDEQVRAGIITKEEAKRSRYRNIITRSIGSDRDVDVDFFTIELKKGDNILLTTDGLTRVVEDIEIYKKTIFNSPQKAVENLIELANKRGGPDNITICLVRIGSTNLSLVLIPSILILLSLLFFFILKPSFFGLKSGTLSIDSEPKEAKVYLNDTYKGLTPLKLTLSVGEYKIRLIKENYKEITQDTKIEENKTTELKFTLEPLTQVAKTGTLELSSNPSQAKVYINNEYKGDTPLTLELNVGTYNLKITKSGYQDYTDTIKIEENKILKISPKLSQVSTPTPPTPTQKVGYLSVNSNPTGADVYINDKLIGKTPIKSYQLNEGSYTLKLKKDGYNEFSKKIDITNNKTNDLGVINLMPFKIKIKIYNNNLIKYLLINNKKTIEYEYEYEYNGTDNYLEIDFIGRDNKDNKDKVLSKLTINIKDISHFGNKIQDLPICFGIFKDGQYRIYYSKFEIKNMVSDNYDLKPNSEYYYLELKKEENHMINLDLEIELSEVNFKYKCKLEIYKLP